MRVLVVDDHSMTRTLMKRTLNELGFDLIDAAVDGDEAFQKLQSAVQQKQPYQIVFVDWNMPNMTGIELLKKCKSEDSLKKTVYVMVTAEREQESVVEALKSGVSDYIVKPFSADQIRAKITRLVSKLLVA